MTARYRYTNHERLPVEVLVFRMDPADVRRKNLITKFMEARATASGQTYDVGDY